MFSCNACLRRAIRNLTSDLPPDAIPGDSVLATSRRLNFSPYHVPSARPKTLSQHRNHATLASLRKGHHRRDLIKLNENSKGRKSPLHAQKNGNQAWKLSKVDVKDGKARDRNKAWLLKNRGVPTTEREVDEEDEADQDEGLIRPSQAIELRKDEIKALRNQSDADAAKKEAKLERKASKDVEQYYQDPLQLSNAILERLRVPDIDGALRLVRASEQFAIKNVVSWNHCMDWLMGQGNVNQSLSVYNEMKKRGRMPDAHTYTIMLRGLSENVHQPRAVQEAIKIYNSIFAPNSAVKPNTIHTNAIINVCARGGDLDALWAVVGRLPERGPGSPDKLTYTLIFNSIRENAIKEVARTTDKTKFKSDAGAAEDERKVMFERAISDGQKLWEDVSYKWRRADMVIDEELVCAMGRLLLGCGIGKELEQVLDLIDSTMNVRIQERTGKARVKQLPAKSMASPNATVESGQTFITSEEGVVTKSFHDKASKLPLQNSNVYAVPGQRTLTLIMEACYLHSPIRQWASSYWHVLTTPNGDFKIKPDATNIAGYLRVLRLNRASAQAYELLSQKWPSDITKKLYARKYFVLAFAACARDKNNPNVFDTAQKLLKLMQDKLEETGIDMFEERMSLGHMSFHQRKKALAKMREETKTMTKAELEDHARLQEGVESMPIDPKIAQYFIELAIDTTKGWNEGLRGKDDGEVFERHPAKNHTMIALKTIGPLSGQLKRLLKIKLDELHFDGVQGNRDRKEKALALARGQSRVAERVEEMLKLMRTMIGAFDRMVSMDDRFKKMNKPGIDQGLIDHYRSWNREYTSYMARIEKTMAQKMQEGKAFASQEDLDIVDAEDVEQKEPEIERRIKAVLGEVDTKILQERAAKKGRTFVEHGEAPRAKISSRKQEAQRRRQLGENIERAFPRTNYGVLDNNLELVTDAAAQDEVAANMRRRSIGNLDINGHPERSAPARPRSPKLKRREPMIGDELGLDDDEAEQDVQSSRSIAKEDIPFAAGTIDEHGNTARKTKTWSSILGHPNLKRAWGESANAH